MISEIAVFISLDVQNRNSVGFRRARGLFVEIMDALDTWSAATYCDHEKCGQDFQTAAEYFLVSSEKNNLLSGGYRDSARVEVHVEMNTRGGHLKVVVHFYKNKRGRNPSLELEFIIEPETGRISRVIHRTP